MEEGIEHCQDLLTRTRQLLLELNLLRSILQFREALLPPIFLYTLKEKLHKPVVCPMHKLEAIEVGVLDNLLTVAVKQQELVLFRFRIPCDFFKGLQVDVGAGECNSECVHQVECF